MDVFQLYDTCTGSLSFDIAGPDPSLRCVRLTLPPVRADAESSLHSFEATLRNTLGHPIITPRFAGWLAGWLAGMSVGMALESHA